MLPRPSRRPLILPLERRRRLVRAGLLVVAGLFLGTHAPPHLFKPTPASTPAVVTFDPIPLDQDNPRRTRLGELSYLQGWSLASDNRRFGGISAMHVVGRNVLAISDSGWTIRFPLPSRGGKVRAMIATLPDGPGSPFVKHDRDSEAMAIAGDRAWLAFERRNAVWRYELPGWRSQAHSRPKALSRWRDNSGSEGLVRLPGGRFLVFAERREEDGTSAVAAFIGDPAVPGTRSVMLRYRPPAGYRLTDAAVLPDGRLLILNRRFSLWDGFTARLVVAKVPALEAGAVISGRELADLRLPLAVDNMEALSITRENGRTIVWIASDDNYNPLQRTLLLKFALVPPRSAGRGTAQSAVEGE
jgi:hypothetical protein